MGLQKRVNSTNVLLLDPKDPRWFDFVDSHPNANLFHHPAWMNLLQKCYGYSPRALAVFNDKGNICAGIPFMEVNSWLTRKRWISLPFSDHCMPLFDNQESLAQLVNWFNQAYSENRVSNIELRWKFPDSPSLKIGPDYFRHIIPLNPDPEEVARKFKRTHKQNISTAENRGVRVESGNQLEHIKKYYQLQLETRRRHGVPAQPWHFFKEIVPILFNQGLGFVQLAYYDDECIAGIVFFHWHNSIIAKYAASKEDTLQLRPNNLLFWTGIEWACKHGYSSFDFGRTEASNTGLIRYKRGWGTIEEHLSYSSFSEKPISSQEGKIHHLIQSVIRKSPLWLCRISGEILYKHFG